MKNIFFVVLVASEKNLDLCLYPKGISNETGLKYDQATQKEVGMHLKSQIENKTKSGYILLELCVPVDCMVVYVVKTF